MSARLTLVGDGIENPLNALTLTHAAELFGADVRFRDRKRLAESWATVEPMRPLPQVSLEELGAYSPMLALDNLDHAEDLFGYRLPRESQAALVVGNERRGIAHEVQARADRALEIPMASRGINCLNVAAAASVALYSLMRGQGASTQIHPNPERRRPDVLLVGARDHFELGSAIRSAGALGWTSLLIDDRFRVWFGVDRATRSEGRAAARRARNSIRLRPIEAGKPLPYDEAVFVTAGGDGVPLQRANLACGQRQLLVFVDEVALPDAIGTLGEIARTTISVRLDLPLAVLHYHFHLMATVALAEAARQIGRPAPRKGAPQPPSRLRYRSEIPVEPPVGGEVVDLDDLADY
jgi:hypothetical protein